MVKQEPEEGFQETASTCQPVEPVLPTLPSAEPSTSAVTCVKTEPKDTKPRKCALSLLLDDEDDVAVTSVIPAPSPSIKANLEVDTYQREPKIPFGDDPLKFWATHECQYPLLANVARALLCIQGSSTASERMFSTAGDIVGPLRSNLDCERVDQLVFLKKNLTEDVVTTVLQTQF